MNEPISVHVWSDIACPWCYIGKRRFEKGVALYGGPVAVEYHSFELAPDTPVDFEGSAHDFLAGHKGIPQEQAARMIDQVVTLAAGEGLDYRYDLIRHTKTLKAHELLHLARAHGRQLETAELLFAAYFEQGRHAGHVDDLVEIAAEAGLDPDDARRVLEDGTFAGAVAEDIAAARRLGINGVPFYVVDGRYGVSGAQAAETFAHVLRTVAEEHEAADGDREPAASSGAVDAR